MIEFNFETNINEIPLTKLLPEDTNQSIGKEFIYKAKGFKIVCDLIYNEIIRLLTIPNINDKINIENIIALSNSLLFNFQHYLELYIKGLGYYKDLNIETTHSSILDILNSLKDLNNEEKYINAIDNLYNYISNMKDNSSDVRYGAYPINKHGEINYFKKDENGYLYLKMRECKFNIDSMTYNLNLLETYLIN